MLDLTTTKIIDPGLSEQSKIGGKILYFSHLLLRTNLGI
jgi:hypothetical protein